ncbi:uroporphyrinogen-III C-methyltransferase [Chelatococcus daeguensis]|uniref:siroheme synthase CysG n=1 Tax=Chelatococcus daeguensis TaxID=444444 RepID=UPI0007ABD018|nr:siroheme synthase CysG [Chelatococcus daeguensis]KZE36280.1 siroheme synthase [Chelatococcus daeguensis]MBM3084243.1 uroporphyrinogen-III C-methyltransferase [Chelatococcus daeguensis]
MGGLRYFPISYDVGDRLVVIVGGGDEAFAKLRLLGRSQARLRLVAPALEQALAAFVETNGIDHRARTLAADDLAEAALVFIGTGDEGEDARLAARARAAGVPVNVVDRPHLSDFAVPAIVDRAPVAVAISTDGLAPVLAQRIRAAVESMLAPEFGRLGELARALRAAVTAAIPTNSARLRFWNRLFDGPAGRLALAGDLGAARRAALSALSAGAAEDGVVWLIGAGPGSSDLLTLRAQRLLLEADVIVHDGLVPQEVVDMGRRDAERIAVGKAKGRHSVSQSDIDALMVRLARQGKRVARLKAGDPLVFGRAGEELAALRAAGIRAEVVPGVTAALAAAADAQVSLTLRGVASSLTFATGHGAEGGEPAGWPAIAAAGGTVAVYMGRTVAEETQARFIAAGVAPDTPVVAVENAGRMTRRLFAGTLADLPALSARADVDGPVLILVGPTLAHSELKGAEPIAEPIPRRQPALAGAA